MLTDHDKDMMMIGRLLTVYQEKANSSCMVDSVVGCLGDAVKGKISMSGQALLQWDFMSNGFPAHSVKMPEDVVDQILIWRDQSIEPNAPADRTAKSGERK